jgi:hypothetical protein
MLERALASVDCLPERDPDGKMSSEGNPSPVGLVRECPIHVRSQVRVDLDEIGPSVGQ